MKRKIIVSSLILILFLLPFTLGENFAGYKYTGDKFSLNGDNFSLRQSKDWKIVFIKINDESFIVANNSCTESSLKFYNVCFRGAIVDFEEDIGMIDEKSGETIPALNLTISYRKPEISVNRTFSKINPLVGEGVNVVSTIVNDGGTPAYIEYVDFVPLGFDVNAVENAAYNGQKIEHHGIINPGSRNTLSYRITPEKELNETIKGVLRYNYETINGTINLDNVSIATSDRVSLNLILGDNIGLEEAVTLSINLTNNDQKNGKQTKLSFSLPKELKVTSFSKEIKKIGELYSFETFLTKDESRILSVGFMGTKTGDYVIPFNISYDETGGKHLKLVNKTINVDSKKIIPSLVIDEENIMSGQKLSIKGILTNNDSIVSYYKIVGKLKSEFADEDSVAEKINQDHDITLFDSIVIVPVINITTNFPINFSGEYFTSNNEMFNFSAKTSIDVHPASELIILYHEFDKYTNDSDKARIKVYVENNWDKTLDDVDVYETIPESVRILDGSTQSKMYIEPGRKTLAYVYTLQRIEGITPGEVTTTLKYSTGGNEYTLIQPININISSKTSLNQNAKDEVTIEKNDTNNADESIGTNANATVKDTSSDIKNENTQPEKKSLWKRFILWLDSVL